MESSRRDLLNDTAEHRPILKISQNTHYPRFSFTPKTGIELPKKGILFLQCGKLCGKLCGKTGEERNLIILKDNLTNKHCIEMVSSSSLIWLLKRVSLRYFLMTIYFRPGIHSDALFLASQPIN